MKRFLVLSLMALLFIGSVAPQHAGAYYESDTMTAYYDEYIVFDLSWGNSGHLSYTVSVASGDPNADIFFMDSSEYYKYQNGETFYYYIDCSRKNTRYATLTCAVEAGSYVLVFDNTVQGDASPYYGQSATFTYTVETTEGSGNNGDDDGFFLSWFVCMFLFIIMIVVIAAVAISISRKRRRAAVQQQAHVAYSTPPPAQYTAPPPVQHHHQHQPVYTGTAPPPSTPPGYGPSQPVQAHTHPHQPYQSEPAEPPKLELPGMMGGTQDTLEETYSGPPKPPKD
jgi:hypothetical protein